MSEPMNISITILREHATLPSYATEHAAGMDLAACIDDPMTIAPHQRVIVPTGLAVAVPAGHEAQIRARSGLASKFGITLANGVGTIDADYRGEVGVILLNTSDEAFVVEPGMRVAQMVVARYEKVEWNVTEVLDSTERGIGGYGSTGK